MKSHAALSALVVSVTIAFASEPKLADKLQPGALTPAHQLGSSELGCPAAVTKVLRQETIAEPQGTGWYEPPHRAEYIIAVSGCGKRAQYAVACDNRHTGCKAGPVTAPGPPPQTLADRLQPNAIKSAQQSGSSELGCPAAAAQVIHRATLDEPATSGWYEPPHRAAYEVEASGCEKSAKYLVTCDDRKKDCSVAALQDTSQSAPAQRQLADELQPQALKAAQTQRSSAL